VEQWSSGAVEQWSSGAVEQWSSGAVEQWSRREILVKMDVNTKSISFANKV